MYSVPRNGMLLFAAWVLLQFDSKMQCDDLQKARYVFSLDWNYDLWMTGD